MATIPPLDRFEDSEYVTPGVYYVLQGTDTVNGRPDRWLLQEDPPRTNRSREVKTEGWLGTTNDVSWHAHGRVEIRDGTITPITETA